jgi:preprotein translocase subunit SecG
LFVIWVVFHVLVSIALILVVLMQSSKGEGLAGSAFGGGGGLSGAVFGGRGAATFLSKATTVLAILFMVNCAALAFMSSNRRAGVATEEAESVVTRRAQEERDRMIQEQQQRQQLQIQPTDSPGTNNIQITPGDAQQNSADTAGN